MTNQQRAVQLLARAVQHLERDIPAIYRRAASSPLVSPEDMAQMTGAVIRCMEYSRGLFLQAQALSHGDQELRARIAARTARLEAAIADRQAELQAWLEVPTLIAEAEAVTQTKH